MLPKALLSSISLTMKIGETVGSFPIIWDSKLQAAKFPKSKFFYIRWYISIVYVFINTVFMTVRFGQAACCMEITHGKLFMNLVNVMSWICCSAFHVNTYKHQQDLVEFINHLMKTNQYFQSNKKLSAFCEAFIEILELFSPIGIQGEDNTGRIRSAARKFSCGIYIYSFVQFFVAMRTLDKNPKYLFTLTGITVVRRYKLIPLALLESYMSFYVGSLELLYVMFFLAYVKSTEICLCIIW